MTRYKYFFGSQRGPFPRDNKVGDLYPLLDIKTLADRFLCAFDLGAVGVVTREVGTGKSTSLRFASAQIHPCQYRKIPVTSSIGSIIELLKQILLSLQMESRSLPITLLTKALRTLLFEITAKKQESVLIIEAHLMRIEVFAQLHTFPEFDLHSKPLVLLILCGQNILLAKLIYHSPRPPASHVGGRDHRERLTLKEMEDS